MRNALIAAACVLILFPAFTRASTAYDQGVAEAQADLAKKEGYRYTYGLPGWRHLDHTTGLPTKSIAGCLVNDEILDRARGYNETTDAWIKQNGLPANSRKQWIDAFKDLPALWSNSAGAFKPAKAATESAEAPYAVALEPLAPEAARDDLKQMAFKVTTDTGPVVITLLGETAEIAWGPKGSRTMIVRTTQPAGTRYYLIDLRNGFQLDMQLKIDEDTPKA